MATHNGTKKPETETQRRARHMNALWRAAGLTQGNPTLLERAVRASVYASIPGRQKRNAAYMLQAREVAVKAACRALRRRGSR